jgi:hypothetical protein
MKNVTRTTDQSPINRRRFIAGGAAGGAAVATALVLPSFGAEALANGGSADPRLVLQLLGSDVAEERDIPPINDSGGALLTDKGLCFDVDLLNLRTGKMIGTATDCLALLEEQGDGVVLVGTTIFNMPGGSFTSRGVTTVEPIADHSQVPSSSAATHTTGSIPEEPPVNNVIAGSGRFADFEASVRLSGAVNMSQLDSDGIIAFDCVFVITPL